MKTIEFETVQGLPVSLVPDKIGAILTKPLSGITAIFIIGDSDPFEVMGTYEETMKRIKEL